MYPGRVIDAFSETYKPTGRLFPAQITLLPRSGWKEAVATRHADSIEISTKIGRAMTTDVATSAALLELNNEVSA